MRRWLEKIVLIILFTILVFRKFTTEYSFAEKSHEKILHKNNTIETIKRTIEIVPNPTRNKINISYINISGKHLLTNLTIKHAVIQIEPNSTVETPTVQIVPIPTENSTEISDTVFSSEQLLTNSTIQESVQIIPNPKVQTQIVANPTENATEISHTVISTDQLVTDLTLQRTFQITPNPKFKTSERTAQIVPNPTENATETSHTIISMDQSLTNSTIQETVQSQTAPNPTARTLEQTAQIVPNPTENGKETSHAIILTGQLLTSSTIQETVQIAQNSTDGTQAQTVKINAYPTENTTEISRLANSTMQETIQIAPNPAIKTLQTVQIAPNQNNLSTSHTIISTERLLRNITAKKRVQMAPSPTIDTVQLLANLTIPSNLTYTQLNLLHTWKILNPLINISNIIPQTVESVQEAGIAWKNLLNQVQNKADSTNTPDTTEKQCPFSIWETNTSKLLLDKNHSSFSMKIPCGMATGSLLSINGTPGGNFKIELIGSSLPAGEPDPPVILIYHVRMVGPVIKQDSWSGTEEWGPTLMCPPEKKLNHTKKVDGLKICKIKMRITNEQLILKYMNRTNWNNTEWFMRLKKRDKNARKHFPFKKGLLTTAFLSVGAKGIHMVVNEKHITSFAYRLHLEPWLVRQVKISGDIKLESVVARGLPKREIARNVSEFEMLKALQIAPNKTIDLFIGVISASHNFNKRMAVRKTWMQYEDVRAGNVAVRFFVGLSKSESVNEELWNEAIIYGDIQILPYVDYYYLITWKTIAICIYATDAVSARYVMKTDDDSFVRVDRILASIEQTNTTHGLLYGHMNNDSQPIRTNNSPWYIAKEEWAEEKYPPWANGPGYVVSIDIAKAIHEQHKQGSLKMFKLEDVAMAIWIDKMRNEGLEVKYANEDKMDPVGCMDNFVVAHYQNPKKMLCLWKRLQKTKTAICCNATNMPF